LLRAFASICRIPPQVGIFSSGTWEFGEGELTIVRKNIKFIPNNELTRELIEAGFDPNKSAVVGQTEVLKVISSTKSTLSLEDKEGDRATFNRVGK